MFSQWLRYCGLVWQNFSDMEGNLTVVWGNENNSGESLEARGPALLSFFLAVWRWVSFCGKYRNGRAATTKNYIWLSASLKVMSVCLSCTGPVSLTEYGQNSAFSFSFNSKYFHAASSLMYGLFRSMFNFQYLGIVQGYCSCWYLN